MASEPATGPASTAPGKVPAGTTAGVPDSSGTPARSAAEVISPDEFFRADVRVGLVVRAEEFPEARNPAYKLWIDFGELGTRTSSAQITALYQPVDLVGRLVIAVVNFPPRRVAGFASEVLVLGVPLGDRGNVALIQPDHQVPPGTAVC